jgi:hypothetical protein
MAGMSSGIMIRQNAAPAPQRRGGSPMGLFLVLSSFFWPRAGIIGVWIFSDLLGRAYDSWILPALGFLLLPWTTIAYAFMWGASSDRVAGAEWLVVAAAFLLDVITWFGWRAMRR